MSRHQGNDKSKLGSGRQGGFKKTSNSRGNAPIKKTPSKNTYMPNIRKKTPPAANKINAISILLLFFNSL